MGATIYDPNLQKNTGNVEDILSSFHKSLSTVQDYTGSFDELTEGYARPALSFVDESFARRPVITLFLIMLSIFSCIPIITFIIFSSLAVLGFAVTALVCALTASLLMLLFFASILLLTVAFMALVAGGLTAAFVSSYLVLRLGIRIRQGGITGVYLWINDIQEYIFGKTFSAASPSESSASFSSSEKAQDSMVLIPSEGSSETIKEETVDSGVKKEPEADDFLPLQQL